MDDPTMTICIWCGATFTPETAEQTPTHPCWTPQPPRATTTHPERSTSTTRTSP